jgi:two-component system C4-dicarboxylate transport sensor histidine kinase DctB
MDLLELQRLAELGRLSATLLHEISTPLATALVHLDATDHRFTPGVREARRSINQLRRYVDAARQQVRKESTLTDFRLRPQINQLMRVVQPLARQVGVSLIIEPIPDCRLYGDPVKFQQILANLAVNAIEAYSNMPPTCLSKPVIVRMHSEEHFLTIQVLDWGQGISSRQLPRLFEPFYTTKNHGHGLGIGLAIVRQYVTNDFGGGIHVHSSARQGTIFTINLPALYRPVKDS